MGIKMAMRRTPPLRESSEVTNDVGENAKRSVGANELFAERWSRPKPQTVLLYAARLYRHHFPACLATAATALIVSASIAVLTGIAAGRLFPTATTPDLIASSASTGLLVLLFLTPFAVGRAFRLLVSDVGVVRYPRVRRYRVVGIAVYTLIPAAILVKLFPLGLVAVLFYVWWAFAPLVVLVEGDGGRTALRRSRMLSLGEFGMTALPVALSLALFYIGLVAALRLVSHQPTGFASVADGTFVRTLAADETYDPVTHILTTADGRGSSISPEATYDASSRTLTLPAIPPVPLGVALAWGGVPWLLAGLLDPIRWFVLALLYTNLRARREGWTPAEMLTEIARES
jgi:hypothetical protein